MTLKKNRPKQNDPVALARQPTNLGQLPMTVGTLAKFKSNYPTIARKKRAIRLNPAGIRIGGVKLSLAWPGQLIVFRFGLAG
jgi:hypothetical protein